MITIVDYGMGNFGSIKNMLRKVGADSEITSDPARIRLARKLILPGVGAFDAGMSKLKANDLMDVLNEKALGEKIPVLGICLGMHLMTRGSEEGSLPGLGWIDASTVRFPPPSTTQWKVPHMGWEAVAACKRSALLGEPGIDLGSAPQGRAEAEERFYFVHSYYVKCEKTNDVLLTATYGTCFDAAFEVGNLMGVQFHPEKSHKHGMRLLRNFAEAY